MKINFWFWLLLGLVLAGIFTFLDYKNGHEVNLQLFQNNLSLQLSIMALLVASDNRENGNG